MQPKSIFRIPLGLLIHSHGATEPLKAIAASNHEVFFELYAPTVDINDPLPPKKESTEADGEVYLKLLKNAMRVHMYALK